MDRLIIFAWLAAAVMAVTIDYAALPSHPRLIFNEKRIDAVLSMNKTDTYYQDILARIQRSADVTVASPLSITSAESWSSSIRMDVGAVAGTYLLTKNTTYSDWVAESILLLANLPDWDPSDYMDTADIAMTVSLGYDWIYDTLTVAHRKKIQAAIIELAFLPALNSSINSWSEHTNNWAQVTHCSLIMATLAIGQAHPKLAHEILEFSFPKLNTSLEQYAPDGGWVEGYSYGTYAGIFLGLMMGSLDTALGDDLGISGLSGMSNVGAWLTHTFGNVGGFGWADGSWEFSNADSLWSVGYWAQKFNKPQWLQGMLSRFDSSEVSSFQAFLFYNSSLMTPNLLPTMQLYDQFRGVGAMTYRTSWENSSAWFFGLTAGFKGRSHGHLDAGSFVIDYNGYRWAELLGSDSYDLTDYFEAPKRWTYYRCRTEGANTLSISEKTQTELHFANQIPSSNNSLLWAGSFDSSSRFGITNLTSAYSNVTTSVMRGVAFTNGSQIIIRDEVRASSAVDVATSWHTTATVKIGSGKKSATLTHEDTVLKVTLLSPSDAYLHLVDTDPCSAYSPCYEMTNSGIYNLAVRLENLAKEADILLAVTEVGQTVHDFDLPLEEWYPACEEDCWESANIEVPHWLRNSETYF
ncbi:hypothetical protein N7466_010018 [Penicillium verhagenii]|uniref:uncharacterized protein n=1 Tax=Penicillium verhagenii TaxID=1562060 RepID=UPI002545091D|nr:uncharacterized protein N7466_010018 [Penicillium verhagenii]KAJ5919075.1 hypothetical protein N7466_010018 [Penicillium verhagenii]